MNLRAATFLPCGQRFRWSFDSRYSEKLAESYAAALGSKLQNLPKEFKAWDEALKAWKVQGD